MQPSHTVLHVYSLTEVLHEAYLLCVRGPIAVGTGLRTSKKVTICAMPQAVPFRHIDCGPAQLTRIQTMQPYCSSEESAMLSSVARAGRLW